MRARRVIPALVVSLAWTVAAHAAASGDEPRGAFARADARFAEGLRLAATDREAAARSFRDAASIWRSLRDLPLANSGLEANIGNASLLGDDLGRAVAAFRRSLAIDPTNEAARAGLAQARRRVGSPASPIAPTLAALGPFTDAAVARLTPVGLLAAAAGFYVLANALVALRVLRGSRTLVPAVASLVLGALAAAPVALTALADDASAVVTDAVIARRGPDDSIYAAAFDKPLPAGAEVRVIEIRGAWSRVALSDGRDAWVPITVLERVGR